jgi:O-methyltransferase involved in polyketide biosynthesis
MEVHMSQNFNPKLSSVAETLLIPLYYRAMESQRSDAILKDEKAVALVTQMSYDFDQVRKIRTSEGNKIARLMLTREMDRYTRDFLSRNPEAVVVHIGCGLDSRFERVDNGQVEWYDLDFADVIGLRRKYIGDEGKRYHLLGCSVLEDGWLNTVSAHGQRPFLFLAEAVFMFLEEAQVKRVVLTLRDHFPGAELVFDGWSPFFVWLGNRQLSSSKFAGLLRWGFWSSRTLEGWGEGIRMLDQWGFFDQPEPRIASYRWIAPIFRLFKPIRIFNFQLGEAIG